MLGRPNSEVLNSIKVVCVWGETILWGEVMERYLSLGHSVYAMVSKNFNFVLFAGLNKVNKGFSGDYYWYIYWADENADQPDHWLPKTPKSTKLDYVLKITKALDPKFREILLLTPAEGIVLEMPVIRDAVIPSFPSTGRVAVVGDAAHPIIPCKSRP
ncbi:hypothetical protein RRF57_012788 [Xylaria bambusicola]|uniref:FAD-binding domain-containing protein n=1 Tax=Xylaria bambusicola TaxID=326684 RepID=A0AAN7V0Z8_9PEZI